MTVFCPQRAEKLTPVYILLLSRQSSIFYLPYLLQVALQNLLCCEIQYFPKRLIYQFSTFKDFYTQTSLHNKFLKKYYKTMNYETSTHKQHITSIQYPSYKCLPEKWCLDCFRILIMSWLFKDPAVIMKAIVSLLFKDPIVTVTWLNFNHAQSHSKKWPPG